MSKPSWKIRRRAVFGSMLFAMAVVVYVAVRWDDTSLAQTLVLSSFALIGTVIAAYIGGAAYEDVRTYQVDAANSTTTEGTTSVH
jgi:multisubunit Na+/H+ antiporter MnhG subunit